MTKSRFIRFATLWRCPFRRLAPEVRRLRPPKRCSCPSFHLLGILALLLLCAACEIIEEDISGHAVTTIAPEDGAEVPAGATHFRWRAVDRATGYELCITAQGRIVADTLLAADTLGLARSYGCRLRLGAGRYEWTVTAFNSGYETSSPALRLTVAEEPAPEAPEQPEQPGDDPEGRIGEGNSRRTNSSPMLSTPQCGVGSSTPPHAADCNSPRLVQHLRRRRTAVAVDASAGEHVLWLTSFAHRLLP